MRSEGSADSRGVFGGALERTVAERRLRREVRRNAVRQRPAVGVLAEAQHRCWRQRRLSLHRVRGQDDGRQTQPHSRTPSCHQPSCWRTRGLTVVDVADALSKFRRTTLIITEHCWRIERELVDELSTLRRWRRQRPGNRRRGRPSALDLSRHARTPRLTSNIFAHRTDKDLGEPVQC